MVILLFSFESNEAQKHTIGGLRVLRSLMLNIKHQSWAYFEHNFLNNFYTEPIYQRHESGFEIQRNSVINEHSLVSLVHKLTQQNHMRYNYFKNF